MSISIQQQALINLLADGEFHSGTKIAAKLAISRTTVWKQLHALTALGLEFTAISGKGYQLNNALELLSYDKLQAELSSETLALINNLEIHPCLASTNSYLTAQARLDPTASGKICLTEVQTAGRGRRGRNWVSPFGSNIYLSILWKFQHGFNSIAGLSLVVGVAVIRVLHNLGVENIGLKWPNDIYWQAQKLGGILVEVSGEAEGQCQAVIGLGLNLSLNSNMATNIDQAWTDLEHIIGTNNYSRNQITASLLNQLLPILATFEAQGLSHYLTEWRSYDCLKNQVATIQFGDQTHVGTVLGIDDNGLLLFQNSQTEVKAFASGDVSFHKSTA